MVGSFRPAPAKIQQILEAGRTQLSPEEFEEMEALLLDLEIYGLTPWINTQLGKLMAKITWELDVGESPEWHRALQECDFSYLGRELKDMCYEVGASPAGHKKELCARLYRRKHPAVVAVMEPFLKEMTPEQIKQEITRHAKVVLLPQTEHPYVDKLRKIKDRLEDVHRKDPKEFYHRKKLFQDAIKKREKGKADLMTELNIEELKDLLKFTDRLYR